MKPASHDSGHARRKRNERVRAETAAREGKDREAYETRQEAVQASRRKSKQDDHKLTREWR